MRGTGHVMKSVAGSGRKMAMKIAASGDIIEPDRVPVQRMSAISRLVLALCCVSPAAATAQTVRQVRPLLGRRHALPQA